MILIICINNNYVSGNDQAVWNSDDSMYSTDSMSESSGLARRGVWSRLFRHEVNPARMSSHSHYAPTAFDRGLPTDQVHILPFDKRTIPIELRKALFAHGIIGRRR